MWLYFCDAHYYLFTCVHGQITLLLFQAKGGGYPFFFYPNFILSFKLLLFFPAKRTPNRFLSRLKWSAWDWGRQNIEEIIWLTGIFMSFYIYFFLDNSTFYMWKRRAKVHIVWGRRGARCRSNWNPLLIWSHMIIWILNFILIYLDFKNQ